MYAGGSARDKAASLRVEAAALREQAELKMQEAQQWDSGAEGEARVGCEMARLDAHGWRTLHDRLIRPGASKANLDHVAVGPGGVVLVDSKNWASGAWLYDGMLFRIGPSGSTACRRELGNVKRDAAILSNRVGHPVTPVLCLSGARTGKVLAPVEVAGVHVVPVGALARFLRTLPETTVPSELEALERSLDEAFPSACLVPPPAALNPGSDFATVKRRRRNRRRTGPTRRAFRPILAIGVLLAFAAIAPKIPSTLGSAIGHQLVPSTTASAALPPFTAPCAAVTDGQVAQTVGRPVHRFATSGIDTCRWSYSAFTVSSGFADVQITTGWLVRFDADAAHGVVQRQRRGTSESILVPQFAAVPGSPMPASATTQPLSVSVHVAGGVTSAAAAHAVGVLAQLTEMHMPTGPGAARVASAR